MPDVRKRGYHQTDTDRPSRPGADVDRQGTAMSSTIYFESVDGRSVEDIPWELYNGSKWTDEGGEDGEVLRLLFMNRSIVVRGLFLKEQLRYLRARRLLGFRQNTDAEKIEIQEWNESRMADQTAMDKIEAIVHSFTMTPEDFQEVIDSTLSRRELIDGEDD